MYQMPVHFGPCCGPRRGPDGERLYKKGSQESTQHMLVYETDAKAVSRYLPEGFSVRMPYIIITHKMHRNLPWLAGHGYNVTTFNVPVTYCGTNDEIKGQYQLAIWEKSCRPYYLRARAAGILENICRYYRYIRRRRRNLCGIIIMEF